MKGTLIFFGNGEIGYKILEYLLNQGDYPQIVVLHREEKASRFDELCALSKKMQAKILYADLLKQPEGKEVIKTTNPYLGVSAYFGYIIPKDIIELFESGIVNLHGSLLPWNRGTHPNVWTIVDNTPAGVTLHFIDEGIDTGPIIAQDEIVVTPDMTGKDLYEVSIEQLVSLFKRNWKRIREGNIIPKPQQGSGSLHHRSQLEKLKMLNLDATMTIGKVIDILRACTFPPYPGASFIKDGETYEIQISIRRIPNEQNEE